MFVGTGRGVAVWGTAVAATVAIAVAVSVGGSDVGLAVFVAVGMAGCVGEGSGVFVGGSVGNGVFVSWASAAIVASGVADCVSVGGILLLCVSEPPRTAPIMNSIIIKISSDPTQPMPSRPLRVRRSFWSLIIAEDSLPMGAGQGV